MNGKGPQWYWLIARRQVSWMETLTVRIDGRGEVLPVFSFEEEAGLFLECGVPGDGWQVRQTSAGELASVLSGPCAGVENVALDPLLEMDARMLSGLLCVDRDDFAGMLLERNEDAGARVTLEPARLTGVAGL